MCVALQLFITLKECSVVFLGGGEMPMNAAASVGVAPLGCYLSIQLKQGQTTTT